MVRTSPFNQNFTSCRLAEHDQLKGSPCAYSSIQGWDIPVSGAAPQRLGSLSLKEKASAGVPVFQDMLGLSNYPRSFSAEV